ncbi:hypothetical protein GCM10010435_17820 [Winogradskya consettensis]|uniref:Uncharacterized protein n=1 Tax=Winogradskya consettensis TaxID=113560 RepID=A0A919VVQ8_9ACTN|nr:hypothetical protein [Actinoplanes consettensis]GIM78596.1 hypothetical protein Aco04nite_61230 [Actinoplanes consettensis]
MRALRIFLGAVTLVLGLTWLLLNLTLDGFVRDLIVGVVLAAAGLVLLMPHRVALPLVPTAVITTVVTLVGMAAGLLAVRSQLSGMWAFNTWRGWPYEWLNKGASAEMSDAAQDLAAKASWEVPDFLHVLGDLYFWAMAGLLVAAVINKRRFRT